jgi:capping protein (actin filament) muscle Z-line, alpha
MDAAEQVQVVANFVLQLPLGEINDVLNGMKWHWATTFYLYQIAFLDIRNIVPHDELLQEGIRPALKEYNLVQFITVDVPGNNHQVCWWFILVLDLLSLRIQTIVSEVGQVAPLFEGEERFLDPRSKTTFAFDHISLVSFAYFHFNPVEPM